MSNGCCLIGVHGILAARETRKWKDSPTPEQLRLREEAPYREQLTRHCRANRIHPIEVFLGELDLGRKKVWPLPAGGYLEPYCSASCPALGPKEGRYDILPGVLRRNLV
jgi:hypothetical protein